MLIELAIGGAAVGLGSLISRAAFNPESQLFGRTLVHGSRANNKVALTFDDGPNDPATGKILDVLRTYSVPATFFVVGQHATRCPDLIRGIAEGGHEIGNHTFAHKSLAWRSTSTIESEIDRGSDAIGRITGTAPKLLRPPYGSRNPMLFAAARKRNLPLVLWSMPAFDWMKQPAQRVVDRIVPGTQNGDVLLFHDGDGREFGVDRSHTVEALPQIIETLMGRGLRFVTVSEMFEL
jgi:peptidoglycan/xylan/chitin deacetylase (PgdA/CDA1 family)